MPVKHKAPSVGNIDKETPCITLLRSATCYSLYLRSILKYELGTDPEGAIWLRLSGTSGAGFFRPLRGKMATLSAQIVMHFGVEFT